MHQQRSHADRGDMTEQWSVFRGHFFIRLKRCNTPKMFMAGMVILSVWTLGMLYISWHQRSTYAETRKMATSDFRQTSQRVEKQTAKTFLVKYLTATTAIGSVEDDSTNRTSVQNNRAELSGPWITKRSCSWRNGSEQRWCFNGTEVQNMREHILKFYNPETNLTLTQSSVRIGQRLTYEILSKKVTATKDLLKLLPEESPLKDRHFKTCAVVGNSGIVLNSSCGQEIDSMDFVIRCNLPQIEGYERDVGSKANLTTMNPSVIPHDFGKDYHRLSRRLKQVGDQILYVPGLTSPSGEMHVRIITQIVLQHKLEAKITFPAAGMNTLMKSIWSNAGFETLRPSTGAHMYTLAATICDQIHMYGFYPFSEDTRGRALGYHYYDTKEMISNRTHNMPEEFRAFQQLHMRGALVLHTEPCQ
ncbi:CMP-N-acetylneuraminate-poly-alpha-2,8-sialyltransferase-like [Branchiostoma floridae x Branchiostoma japonicum]